MKGLEDKEDPVGEGSIRIKIEELINKFLKQQELE